MHIREVRGRSPTAQPTRFSPVTNNSTNIFRAVCISFFTKERSATRTLARDKNQDRNRRLLILVHEIRVAKTGRTLRHSSSERREEKMF